MAGYASHQREPSTRTCPVRSAKLQLAPVAAPDDRLDGILGRATDQEGLSGAVVSQLVDRLAERIAFALAERLSADDGDGDDWLDSRHAAEYLGLHRDTLRKLAAERTIPSEQDGPGCKLYFRRSDLDAWRRCGGRPRHLASNLASVA
jgi:excisionase family DNA binding protein